MFDVDLSFIIFIITYTDFIFIIVLKNIIEIFSSAKLLSTCNEDCFCHSEIKHFFDVMGTSEQAFLVVTQHNFIIKLIRTA